MNIDPHKDKYHDLYWNLAWDAASQSCANRLKVGAVIVTETGMLSVGWNGMPAGFENECELYNDCNPSSTKPEVIHAERNAIDKLTRQGIPAANSILFITHSPCIECAKSIHAVGFKTVYYDQPYRALDGIVFLARAGVAVVQR